MAPTAIAEVTGTAVDQTVDQLEVFSSKKVLRLKFDVTPTQLVGLTAAPTSNLRACQSSANNGLICLDGQVVRQWSSTIEHPIPPGEPITPAAGTALFSCSDTAFAFKAGNPCTTMTVDTKGGIWVAGLKSTNSYSLMQVVKKNAADRVQRLPRRSHRSINRPATVFARALPAGRQSPTSRRSKVTSLSSTSLKARESLASRGARPSCTTPTISRKASGRSAAGPRPCRAPQFSRRVESTVLQTYVVVAVSSGIVYSRVITSGDDGTESKFVHANSNSDPLKLPRGARLFEGHVANQFGVRASETSGRVFITNRNYCRAYVLTPLPLMQGIDLPVDTVSTMSTSGTYPPDGLERGTGHRCQRGAVHRLALWRDLGGCPLIETATTQNLSRLRMYQSTWNQARRRA